jgi:hypothetical protein
VRDRILWRVTTEQRFCTDILSVTLVKIWLYTVQICIRIVFLTTVSRAANYSVTLKRLVNIATIDRKYGGFTTRDAQFCPLSLVTVITEVGDPMVGLGGGPDWPFITVAVLESSANPTDGGS